MSSRTSLLKMRMATIPDNPIELVANGVKSETIENITIPKP